MSTETVELISRAQVDQLLSRLPGSESVERPSHQASTSMRSPISGTLDPYTGEWDYLQAGHLLRRTMIGPTKAQIEEAVENGPDVIIAQLLADQPLPDPPINYFYQEDPFTPVGETWINSPSIPEYYGYRRASLYAWAMGNLLEEGISIRERLTLFWHNHFVTAEIPVPKVVYQYINLLRENALGNFRELTKMITVNPAMLIYLNGRENSANAPNENYSRELNELFTVGKGDLAGPGDYTTFTEKDVQEMARILTGWRVRLITDDGSMASAFFNPARHDDAPKQLSHRFDNAVIQPNGDQEYSDLIDVIFQSPHTAIHICRKLYRWFVYYKIDETIESDIIEPMAELLRENDYNIKPVLEVLLKSQHFYDVNSIGCIIKNPIEHIVSTIKQFEIPMPGELRQRYALWNGIFRLTELAQMVYFFPPSVAGWKAFYQEPGFNQIWINTVTLIVRQLYSDIISTVGYEVFDRLFRIEALPFIATIDNALNPNDLIQGIAQIIYPNPLTQLQIDGLKEVLIPGLPDFEWTVEYQGYLDNPDNEEIRRTVDLKVRALLRNMLARPEYHLS